MTSIARSSIVIGNRDHFLDSLNAESRGARGLERNSTRNVEDDPGSGAIDLSAESDLSARD